MSKYDAEPHWRCRACERVEPCRNRDRGPEPARKRLEQRCSLSGHEPDLVYRAGVLPRGPVTGQAGEA